MVGNLCFRQSRRCQSPHLSPLQLTRAPTAPSKPHHYTHQTTVQKAPRRQEVNPAQKQPLSERSTSRKRRAILELVQRRFVTPLSVSSVPLPLFINLCSCRRRKDTVTPVCSRACTQPCPPRLHSSRWRISSPSTPHVGCTTVSCRFHYAAARRARCQRPQLCCHATQNPSATRNPQHDIHMLGNVQHSLLCSSHAVDARTLRVRA